MPAWEKLDCTSGTANQGYGKCTLDFGMLNYHIAIPKGEKITAAQLADFENTLREKTNEPNPAKRWIVLGPFVTFTQANSDPQSQTAGNGLVRFTNVGQFGWDLVQWAGGFCAYKNMLKFHGKQDQYDFLNIHGGTVLAGVLTTDDTGAEAMKGIAMMQVFIPNWDMSDGGANGTKYQMNFRVGDASQLRENYTAMKLDFDINGVAAKIIDVTFSITQSGTNYDVLAATGCGGEDLSVLYGTELADPDAWVVTNAVTGAVVIPTSVTLTGNKFRFVFTTPPVAGDYLTFNLAPLDELDGLGVVWYEGIPKTIKVI